MLFMSNNSKILMIYLVPVFIEEICIEKNLQNKVVRMEITTREIEWFSFRCGFKVPEKFIVRIVGRSTRTTTSFKMNYSRM